MNTVRVQVPATSANCGPGFDCLGLALNLYNIFSFTPDVNATEYTYTFEGFGADILRAEDPKEPYWFCNGSSFCYSSRTNSIRSYYV